MVWQSSCAKVIVLGELAQKFFTFLSHLDALDVIVKNKFKLCKNIVM
ncbi:MAG: hypothetical protein RL329_1595 [Bacteroidota bacterium]|jgi:hypothetical protein